MKLEEQLNAQIRSVLSKIDEESELNHKNEEADTNNGDEEEAEEEEDGVGEN